MVAPKQAELDLGDEVRKPNRPPPERMPLMDVRAIGEIYRCDRVAVVMRRATGEVEVRAWGRTPDDEAALAAAADELRRALEAST